MVIWTRDVVLHQKARRAASHISVKELGYRQFMPANPWHCLPEHRPLGGINRARKIIYETMSKYRHARNSALRDEPTGWALF